MLFAQREREMLSPLTKEIFSLSRPKLVPGMPPSPDAWWPTRQGQAALQSISPALSLNLTARRRAVKAAIRWSFWPMERRSCTFSALLVLKLIYLISRYCKKSAPDVTTSNTLKVVFTSNKKAVARGAVCTAKCAYTAAGPPAPGPTGMLCGRVF